MSTSFMANVRASLWIITVLLSICLAGTPSAGLLPRGPGDLDGIMQAYASELWEVVLEEPSSENARSRQWRIGPEGSQLERETVPNGYRLVWSEPLRDGEALQLAIELDLTTDGQELCFVFRIRNRQPDCIVRELRGPILGEFETEGLELLRPDSLGRRAGQLHQAHAKRVLYPGWASMQWMSLLRGTHGLYIGSHDESFQTTGLDIDCHGGHHFEVSITKFPICHPQEDWTGAPVVVMPYQGTWHKAADRYRRWAEESWWSDIERPQWVRETSGIQLSILKQQNGEILWDYPDIQELVELSKQSGLDTLGLFGWTGQGHDHLYPYYTPDADMGGADRLAQELREAKKEDRYPFLYADGHRIDVATEFYQKYGDECCMVDERMTHRMEYPIWQKYHNASPVATVNACFGSERWLQLLTDLALQAHELGAAGILYDRIGGCEPYLCFHPDHHHAHPALATGPGKRMAVMRIRERLKAVDPDFAIMAELITDCLCQHIDLIHGHGMGTSDQPGSFPEMFRYTFPEMIVTQRHPTPILDRAMANFATLHGLRHELEYRYAPDIRFMRDGKMPSYRDYIDVVNKPDIDLMRSRDRDTAQCYLKTLIAFEDRHKDLLRYGRFVDTVGFTIRGDSIRAKGFRNDRDLGVVVWNTASKPQKVSVAAAGQNLQGTFEPERGSVRPESALPGQSIRLLRYQQAE